MKIIKLDRRYRLGQKGFQFAFVINNYSWRMSPAGPSPQQLTRLVNEVEPYHHMFNRLHRSYSENSGTRYYVGFNEETTKTYVLLKY